MNSSFGKERNHGDAGPIDTGHRAGVTGLSGSFCGVCHKVVATMGFEEHVASHG